MLTEYQLPHGEQEINTIVDISDRFHFDYVEGMILSANNIQPDDTNSQNFSKQNNIKQN